MAKTADFTIEGGQHIQKALLELPRRYQRQAMKNAFMAGARIVAKEARAQAKSKQIGTKFSKSIVARIGTARDRKRLGKSTIAKVALKKPHSRLAHLFEFGTAPRRQRNGRFTGQIMAKPFLRPALDVAGGRAIKEIARISKLNIETIARQLGAGQKVSLRRKK